MRRVENEATGELDVPVLAGKRALARGRQHTVDASLSAVLAQLTQVRVQTGKFANVHQLR